MHPRSGLALPRAKGDPVVLSGDQLSTPVLSILLSQVRDGAAASPPGAPGSRLHPPGH